MGMTYNYDTGRITRDWVLKKVEHSCKRDPEKTVMIGVMCKHCPYYDGMKTFYSRDNRYCLGENLGTFVFCKYHKDDDEGASEVISKMYEEFREEAITHYYD